jgi:alanine racemase
MRDVSFLEINLGDLDHNIQVLRQIIGPECGLCPIVKADAYGLGAARIAKRLEHNSCDLLAVYTPDQAAELFRAAIGCRVLVLMPVREIARADELYRGLVADRLHLTVHDTDHVDDLVAITEQYGVTVAVHVEIDTGMSRGGCGVAEAPAVLKRIDSCRRLRLAGLFTHFASAESDVEFADAQLAEFDRLTRTHAPLIPKDCRIHVASSFATLRHKRYHKAMVRIGLAWAGYGLEWMDGDEVVPGAERLRPIVAWKSQIVQVKTIAAGTPVGYGSVWKAKRQSVIGLVPVGYADGYPAGLGTRAGKAKSASVGVIAHGQAEPIGFAPVVGAVNMDQMTVDLTDVSGRATRRGLHVGVGTSVELISSDPKAPNHLTKLAALAGTFPHEMLCRLNSRLKRVYQMPVAPPQPARLAEPKIAVTRFPEPAVLAAPI